MSGSELRQYLHISTRKMKYLMDHDYISHENTGQTTHKYRVSREKAERFKCRMETEDGFLAELSGKFSNRTGRQPRRILEPTAENSKAFRLWLEKEWAELPEALPTQTAASLAGFAPQRIHKLIKEKALHGITVRAVQYISKSEFIAYISSPKQIASVQNETYRKLLMKIIEENKLHKKEKYRVTKRKERSVTE